MGSKVSAAMQKHKVEKALNQDLLMME